MRTHSDERATRDQADCHKRRDDEAGRKGRAQRTTEHEILNDVDGFVEGDDSGPCRSADHHGEDQQLSVLVAAHPGYGRRDRPGRFLQNAEAERIVRFQKPLA